MAPQHLDRFDPAVDRVDMIPGILEIGLDNLPIGVEVVDHEDRAAPSLAALARLRRPLAGAGPDTLGRFAVNQTVEPLPTSLAIPISPSINSTSRLQIASPRPVPPYRRLTELSAWENF